jgi:hypothetical protein
MGNDRGRRTSISETKSTHALGEDSLIENPDSRSVENQLVRYGRQLTFRRVLNGNDAEASSGMVNGLDDFSNRAHW